MIRSVLPGLEALASSSDQISWRCPVAASISTIGWFGANAWSMSVSGTAPVFWKAVGLSRPGTRVTMLSPGLKPSLWLMPAGSMWTPWTLAGVESLLKLTRRPVGALASSTV